MLFKTLNKNNSLGVVFYIVLNLVRLITDKSYFKQKKKKICLNN